MPELPEVEVIRRGLQPVVTGRIFSTPELLFPGAVRFPSPNEFGAQLPGCRVTDIRRKGKYLVFNLNRGVLLAHLRMTGQLFFLNNYPTGTDYPYLRVVLPFTDRSALCFSDLRKLGGLWLSLSQEGLPEGFINLGPDMYCQVDRAYFETLLKEHDRAMIKPLLLNQRCISGLGNIYIDESLHLASIHPRRRVATLSGKEIDSLYGAICTRLEKGIECGGASIRDYRDAGRREGNFQHHLLVYGRQGKPCFRCHAPLARIVVGGRGTYYCPRCQEE